MTQTSSRLSRFSLALARFGFSLGLSSSFSGGLGKLDFFFLSRRFFVDVEDVFDVEDVDFFLLLPKTDFFVGHTQPFM